MLPSLFSSVTIKTVCHILGAIHSHRKYFWYLLFIWENLIGLVWNDFSYHHPSRWEKLISIVSIIIQSLHFAFISHLSSVNSSLIAENANILNFKIFDIAVESQLPRYHVGVRCERITLEASLVQRCKHSFEWTILHLNLFYIKVTKDIRRS